jgi:hypothetical protein
MYKQNGLREIQFRLQEMFNTGRTYCNKCVYLLSTQGLKVFPALECCILM